MNKNNPLREKKVVDECTRRISVISERLRFNRLLRNEIPIVVLTVEKVGSVSIYKALRSVYNGALMHAHVFGESTPDWRQKYIENYLRDGGRIKLISSVRNPVARNLSEFFYYYSLRSPSLLEEDSPEATMKFICEFLQKYNHLKQDEWLASSFRDPFGIDIYEKPFSSSGHDIYHSSVADLLIMRCELSNTEKEECIRKFTGCSNVQLGNLNQSETMVGGSLYTQVKKKGLPLSYVQEMLQSVTFKHFYDRDFVAQTIGQWAAK